jgi:Ca-activated chloride channel family protein
MNFTHPHFEEPHWLWLALFAPVLLVLLQRYAAKARRRQLARVASTHFLTELTASHSPVRRIVKNILLVVAVAAIGVALARPQWGEVETKTNWSGEDVVFAIDCSQSMSATDVLPSRLERAKYAVRDFVRRQSRGRVGLIAFAGSAFLQCPLTFDHEAFEDALQALDTRTIAVAGTDLGRALREADKAAAKASRRKVVVLLTDGEDLEKGGVKTAESLATNGIVVFTVGVGTALGGEIVIMNAAGQPELLRDAKGELVRSRLDEETLQAIARATGGEFFPMGRVGEGLARVGRSLIERESSLRATQTRSLGVDRFHLPIAIAIVLLLGESLLGTRRRGAASAAMSDARRATQIGRRGSGVPAAATTMLLMLMFAVLDADAATNETTNAVAPVLASRPPDTARGLYNAGTQRFAEKKLSEAESLLRSALAKQDARVQPAATYNLGHVRFAQGAEELKKSPGSKPTAARSHEVAQRGAQVARDIQEALAGGDTEKMVAAYRAGRGVRKEARALADQFKRAMELYMATLLKWQRSLGDFRSAAELNPADTNATYNAEIVERHIAKLIDSIREMQQAMMPMMGGKTSLGDLMQQLKGKIPAEKMPPGAPGDDDDEDITLEGLRGFQEGPGKEGREMEMPLSPDEAGDLLEGLRLGGERRLPMGRGEDGEQEGPQKEKKRKPW